jgi:thiamine pyrophosphate-dependent acetolactate synthase large subunit-like protein
MTAMNRYQALTALSARTAADDLFVTSLGTLKNEWYSLQPGPNTFYQSLLGGATAIAFGLAVALPHRRVFALDTDGGTLMGAGHFATLANEAPSNLTVLIFDNESYQGVGGHPTHTAKAVDLASFASGAGIQVTATARTVEEFTGRLAEMADDGQLGVLVAKITHEVEMLRPDQRKPTDEIEDKYRFIRQIEASEGVRIRPANPAKRGMLWQSPSAS